MCRWGRTGRRGASRWRRRAPCPVRPLHFRWVAGNCLRPSGCERDMWSTHTPPQEWLISTPAPVRDVEYAAVQPDVAERGGGRVHRDLGGPARCFVDERDPKRLRRLHARCFLDVRVHAAHAGSFLRKRSRGNPWFPEREKRTSLSIVHGYQKREARELSSRASGLLSRRRVIDCWCSWRPSVSDRS